MSTMPHGAPLWGTGVVEIALCGLPIITAGNAVGVGLGLGVAVAVGVAVSVGVCVAVRVMLAVTVEVTVNSGVTAAERSRTMGAPLGVLPHPISNITPSTHPNTFRCILSVFTGLLTGTLNPPR
jgi:hypothetical protein